jgi:hypothetical protein
MPIGCVNHVSEHPSTISPVYTGAERECRTCMSFSMWSVAVSEQEAGHVVIVFGWGCGAAGDPVENVGVGAVEQCLVAVELRLVEPGEMGIGEAAEDQIALPRSAVPGTE